jgi:dTDP-4-dehydrorhamnose 3,5-epimerase
VSNFCIETDGSAIVGVTVRAFDSIDDIRGGLCEIHRDDWKLAPRPVQWDLFNTKANVLRGVHVHRLRWDYIIVVDGTGTIGLKDIRRDAKSFARDMVIEVTGGEPTVVTIPPGVAHGIFANTAMRHLYGLTVAWDGNDEELGCRYDDPVLGIVWPSAAPLVIPRDRDLPDFATLVRQFETRSICEADPAIPPS